MSAATNGPGARALPWTRADLDDCFHCGSGLVHCDGCHEARCLTCDPYTSDDCRWLI